MYLQNTFIISKNNIFQHCYTFSWHIYYTSANNLGKYIRFQHCRTKEQCTCKLHFKYLQLLTNQFQYLFFNEILLNINFSKIINRKNLKICLQIYTI